MVVLPIAQQRFSTPGANKKVVMPATSAGMTMLDEETIMAAHKLLLLPGDGIGPEVMAEVKRLIDWLNAKGIARFETDQGLVGGSAYDASKQSITDATMAQAVAADAVIFGSVGGPKWESGPYDVRP